MFKNVTFLALMMLSGFCAILYSQTSPTWQTLTNVPVIRRYNDVYFVTPKMGWIVNGAGQIYKTTNGGSSWQKQFENSTAHFRSVAFLDSLRGWAGNVGPGEFGATDSAVFYHTKNGGSTWEPIYTFMGPRPTGLCGMHVMNDSVICAVGRVRGPSFFAKTTDSGKTWISKEMSAYAAGLIDVYFFHPDTGYAVGLTNATHDNSSGVILFTADGGETWVRRFITTRAGEWCWKISFPSRRVGYVSLQRNSLTPIYFLKTTDGGNTWEEKLFSSSYYFVQGIGFLTEQIGWIGGSGTFPVFQTTDGGETWQSTNFGVQVNRFRFLSDTLGYAVGQRAYKYSRQTTVGVAANKNEIPLHFELWQNYPNPFVSAAKSPAAGRENLQTTIRYRLPQRARVTLRIYDFLGRLMKELINQEQDAGLKSLTWDGTDELNRPVSAGIYFYTLRADDFTQTRKMVVF
jgi:photosystem II stability/assembly factor-like uncharacterized protein